VRDIAKVVIGVLTALAIAIAVAVGINALGHNGAGANGPTTRPVKTYTSSKYHFSISYDASKVTVNADATPPEGTHAILLNFKNHLASVWVICAPARHVDDAYLRRLLAQVVRSYDPHARLRRMDPAILGSLHGFDTGGVVGKDLGYLTFVVGRGRYAYVISAQGDPATWHEQQPTIFQILDSFMFRT